jgi:hypothetical protein
VISITDAPVGSAIKECGRVEKVGQFGPQEQMELLWIEMYGGFWSQTGRDVGDSSIGIAKIPLNAQIPYLKYRMMKGV